MKIEQIKVKVSELVEGYVNNDEEGVRGFGGKLDIRPPYQREFIYGEDEQKAVIHTIMNQFPLNTMYWMKRDDGNYEVMDGQQRTLSICRFIQGDFSVKWKGEQIYFHNLDSFKNVQDAILNYELLVYVCEGTNEERLNWFKVINIAGKTLTRQEMRNAVFFGPWLTDAKRHFSKSNCAAYLLGKDYMSGTPIRQDYLETVIDWISEGKVIEKYMGKHQHDENAEELWRYFQAVMGWVETVFPKKRATIMKGRPWGFLYNEYHKEAYDADKMEARIQELLLDDDVTAKAGVYEYLLTGNEKHLSIRTFSKAMKISAYERQKGICPHCHEHYEINEMDADHITPWHEGGKTIAENCQMLCRSCNRKKGGK